MNENPASPVVTPVTRRNFLKSTSTAVAGGALLGALSAERFALGASPGDTLKIALIGCGGRGSGAANQALSTQGGTKLIAMADVFKDQLEGSLRNLKEKHTEKVEVPQENKFIGFDAYKQAIALADVVILATPPGFRPMMFEEAVRQGKHIFMEKPVAVDGPGIRRVLEAAAESKRKGLKVGVGLQRHHQTGYLETLKRLHDGEIGDIVAMRAYWNGSTPWVKPRKSLEQKFGRPLTEMEYQMQNWYYFTWICGDHIVEQHIHNLDVINWVKNGHPVRCHGMGGCEVRKGQDYGEIFDHHAVEYEYADGSRLGSQCRHILNCWNDVSEHVVGTKGSCDVSRHMILGPNAWRFRADKANPPKDPYQQEHDDLFDAIRNDKPYNEAEYGAHSSLTAIMGRMATYSGKIVEWDAALNSTLETMPKNLAWDAPTLVNPGADGMYPRAVPGKTASL
ncbi:MAG: Gfo/Idh/MocA family oxidoreductase [Verrucomicrobia bacterium]|nr:Gfo/Idh/MocA family oxidoreductase [Verrucomicrobiota bacterium]MBI3870069.1 Gfo/Idh/MocA family oxidoreductase [Verrucomicrobiota bacterium]